MTDLITDDDPSAAFEIDVPDCIEDSSDLTSASWSYWGEGDHDVPEWFDEVTLDIESVNGDTATIDPRRAEVHSSPTDADYEAAREWSKTEFEQWLNNEYDPDQ